MGKKTLRIALPQWQGGNNPTYFLGSQLLTWLAPKNKAHKEVVIPISTPNTPFEEADTQVVAQERVKELTLEVKQKIEEENPDKIITFGGDCLVSQSPFDYLHGKYQNKLGIIWIDAHPDISTPTIFNHEHAMVLGNLLGKGDPNLASLVENPFNPSDVLYVGLQQPTEDEIALLKEMNLNYQVQSESPLSIKEIQAWIEQNDFDYVAIHLDLDVLDPNEFRMTYFAEPLVEEYGAVAGKMTLKELGQVMAGISAVSEVVGLTIAELLPWDVQNLQQLLSSFDIFDSPN